MHAPRWAYAQDISWHSTIITCRDEKLRQETGLRAAGTESPVCGVRAALSSHRHGTIVEWLRQIKDGSHGNREPIEAAGAFDGQADRLLELNIYQQINNLIKAHVFQGARHEERRPIRHGWAYGINDGLLESLYKVDLGSPMDDSYRFDFETWSDDEVVA